MISENQDQYGTRSRSKITSDDLDHTKNQDQCFVMEFVCSSRNISILFFQVVVPVCEVRPHFLEVLEEGVEEFAVEGGPTELNSGN